MEFNTVSKLILFTFQGLRFRLCTQNKEQHLRSYFIAKV